MVSKNGTAAEALAKALECLAKEIDRDLPLTLSLAFVMIAAAGEKGIDQGELQEKLQASASGMSRTISTLSNLHYAKEKEGFGLIERALDPQDMRRRLLKLSNKGQKLMAKITQEMSK